MSRFLIGASLLALLFISGRAEQIKRDLGFGLTYVRVNSVPADLPTEKEFGSSVLDLRYATGDAASAKALWSWLAQHATTRAPIFILVNSATSTELLQQISATSALPGVLTLSPTVVGFTPDIVININPVQEQRAYSALGSATDIKTLITATQVKVRRDEATMMAAKSRDESIGNEPELELTDAADSTSKNTPPIDSALQRAAQIHRAWAFLQIRNR